ncbi:MAG: hypothetical protein IH600_09395 [Bacteroidetes bacterium]|nr:hypothetical protein [Bacteroidota bacterium]
MQNGMNVSGTLVMVRDSGFVLDLLCQSWKTSADNESSALHWFPSHAVCRVHAPEIPFTATSAGTGFLIGAGVGALLPVATGEPVYALVVPLLFAPIGMIIGVVVDALSITSELDIDPSTPEAMLELHSRAPMIEPSAEEWMFVFDRPAASFIGSKY